jgi:hypothetical protein
MPERFGLEYLNQAGIGMAKSHSPADEVLFVPGYKILPMSVCEFILRSYTNMREWRIRDECFIGG